MLLSSICQRGANLHRKAAEPGFLPFPYLQAVHCGHPVRDCSLC